jgi:hypothetical protein
VSNNGLAGLDDLIHSACAAAGIADQAYYQATESSPEVPCRCYINRAMQQMGDYGPVHGPRVLIEILRADVRDPVQGARLRLASGEVFRLESPAPGTDESMTRWVVGNGR